MNRKVFIIHGHDAIAVEQLKALILDKGLEPIVLTEQDSGKTVYEKFERFAEQCVFAVALLTPDDVVSAKNQTSGKSAGRRRKSPPKRARQNVIFELGWFFRKLGRSRTRLLHRGSVELPSDVTGIVYISFDKHVNDADVELTRAFVSGGLLAPT